jgi:hypothetical protein
MWHCRFLALFALPTLAILALSSSPALGQQTAPAAQPVPAAPPAPKADPKATEALQKAIEQLDPKKVGWLELTLWQHLASQGLAFQAEGNYLSGPDYHLRLNLKIRLAGMAGEMDVVSDGSVLWTVMAVAGQPRTIAKWSLKDVQPVVNNANMIPQVREGFYQSQSFTGIVPVLDNLRQQMVLTKQEKIQWQGHDVFKLTGVWNAEIAKELAPSPSSPWPILLPRECRVFLDAKTYWPYRLEWWGPVTSGGPDILIMETEYRNPQIVNAGDKPPEKYARAFVFDPGKEKVIDKTKDLVDNFTALINARLESAKGTAPKK